MIDLVGHRLTRLRHGAHGDVGQRAQHMADCLVLLEGQQTGVGLVDDVLYMYSIHITPYPAPIQFINLALALPRRQPLHVVPALQ